MTDLPALPFVTLPNIVTPDEHIIRARDIRYRWPPKSLIVRALVSPEVAEEISLWSPKLRRLVMEIAVMRGIELMKQGNITTFIKDFLVNIEPGPLTLLKICNQDLLDDLNNLAEFYAIETYYLVGAAIKACRQNPMPLTAYFDTYMDRILLPSPVMPQKPSTKRKAIP
jgi:hypothetical protein